MARYGGFSENPIHWSFKVGRLFGIDVRVHVAFVLCAVWLLSREIAHARSVGPDWSLAHVMVAALALELILFFIVLVHEFGHCFGARYVGGDADAILLWPLGGLATVDPPHNPHAHMITTVAGPMVNVVFCAISSVALVSWTGRLGAVPWNPLYPMTPVDPAVYPTVAQAWVMRFYGVSYVLLLFNLLPVFPFDGGRMLHAWLWRRKGYAQAMMTATSVGMVGAVVLFLFGLFTEENLLLLMIAVFGYVNCWQVRRQLTQDSWAGTGSGEAWLGGSGQFDDEREHGRRPGFMQRRRARRAAAKAAAARRREELHEQRVEAALRKVSESGLDALTPGERRLLEEETRRRRTRNEDPV